TRRHDGAPGGAGGEEDLDLDRGVAAGVQDGSALHVFDVAHGGFQAPWLPVARVARVTGVADGTAGGDWAQGTLLPSSHPGKSDNAVVAGWAGHDADLGSRPWAFASLPGPSTRWATIGTASSCT